MVDVMWCESCRMRVGIDVDCDIAGHVHRPMRGDQTGTDGWSKDGDDIVTRLREEALRPAMRDVCTDAADEIERLRHEVDLKGSRLDDALDQIERLRTWCDRFVQTNEYRIIERDGVGGDLYEEKQHHVVMSLTEWEARRG